MYVVPCARRTTTRSSPPLPQILPPQLALRVAITKPVDWQSSRTDRSLPPQLALRVAITKHDRQRWQSSRTDRSLPPQLALRVAITKHDRRVGNLPKLIDLRRPPRETTAIIPHAEEFGGSQVDAVRVVDPQHAGVLAGGHALRENSPMGKIKFKIVWEELHNVVLLNNTDVHRGLERFGEDEARFGEDEAVQHLPRDAVWRGRGGTYYTMRTSTF